MAKSTTKSTIASINVAHQAQPYAAGPLLGILVMHAQLPTAFIARMLSVSEDSLMKWFVGEREVPVGNAESVGVLIGLLTWLFGKRSKVSGALVEARMHHLEKYLIRYGLLVQV